MTSGAARLAARLTGGRRPDARRLGAWLLAAVPAAVVTLGVGVPLAYLVARALDADPATLAATVLRGHTLALAGRTLLLSATVLAAATALALPMAWVAVRGHRPRWVTVAGVLPLAVPGYVMAYALLGATGPAGTLAEATGWVIPRASGLPGATAALAFATYPYLFLSLRAALAGLDPAVEEAARSLGLTAGEAARRIVVPQLRPAYLAGALLVLLHVVGDFGVVSLMRYETFSYALYVQYTAGFDRVYAAWLALMLVATAGVLLAAEARLLGRRRWARAAPGAARRRLGVPVSGLRRVASSAFALAVAALTVGLPLATIAFWAGRGAARAAWADVGSAAGATVQAAAPAALVAVALALPLAWVGVRRGGRLGRWTERAAYLGYATPPLAFALAAIVFAVRAAPGVYQTLGLLVAAYALHFLAEALGPVRSALRQAPPSLEDAARSLGRGPLGAFATATLPLARRGMAAGGAFVFLSCLKELPIAFLLAPPGMRTLAMSAWGAAGEALYSLAAPYAVAIVAVAAGSVALLLRAERV